MERIPDASRQVAHVAPGVAAVMDERGLITVRRRRFGSVRGALAKAAGVSPDFTIHLDALGTAAWNLLDGKRTIGEVHGELVRRMPAEKDLAGRLGKFLSTMVSHHMLQLD